MITGSDQFFSRAMQRWPELELWSPVAVTVLVPGTPGVCVCVCVRVTLTSLVLCPLSSWITPPLTLTWTTPTTYPHPHPSCCSSSICTVRCRTAVSRRSSPTTRQPEVKASPPTPPAPARWTWGSRSRSVQGFLHVSGFATPSRHQLCFCTGIKLFLFLV